MSVRRGLVALSQAAAAAMPFVPLCALADGGWPGGSPDPDGCRPSMAEAGGRRVADGFRRLCGRLFGSAKPRHGESNA